jgi:type IV pilus assembly protein PilE
MSRGFTLIEIMIVVAILAILTAIAYPTYIDYVRKTKRAEVKAELLDLASKLQRYKIAHFSFLQINGEPIGLENIGEVADLKFPRSGPALYQIELSDVTANTWILSASPIDNTSQQLDGGLSLNHRGEKCWVKGQKKCDASNETHWDGR